MRGSALRYRTQPSRRESTGGTSGGDQFAVGTRSALFRAAGLCRPDVIVITVPLHRLTSSLADRVTQGLSSLLFRSRHSRHVEDLFAHDRAVQVIDTVA